MPLLDVVDEHFVATDAARLRAATCDEERWRSWFPGLHLDVLDDRGLLGKRWTVSGDLVGTCEVWIEAWRDGVVLHVFLQAEPAQRRGSTVRQAARLRQRYARPLKRQLFAVKDACEAPWSATHPFG